MNAFKATLLPSSNGMILKMPSYNLKPIILQVGSMIPIIPVSDARPIRSLKWRGEIYGIQHNMTNIHQITSCHMLVAKTVKPIVDIFKDILVIHLKFGEFSHSMWDYMRTVIYLHYITTVSLLCLHPEECVDLVKKGILLLSGEQPCE